MGFIGTRKNVASRLAPQLDDAVLGRVLKNLGSARGLGPQDLAIAQVEQLLHDTGDDWDRRGHRVVVLAQAAPFLVRTWQRRQPSNPNALTLQAWVDVVFGRAAGRLDDPRTTLDTCRRAVDACPADPTPVVALFAAMRLAGRPISEIAPVWQEISDRDLWNREAHLQALGYLSPEEQGSHVALREFLDSVMAVMPLRAPPASLSLSAAVQQYHRELEAGGVRSLCAVRYWSQAHVASQLDRTMEQWLTPGFLTHAAAVADLNLLAHALVHARRISDAAPVLRATGRLVTAWPWQYDGNPVERFDFWWRSSSA